MRSAASRLLLGLLLLGLAPATAALAGDAEIPPSRLHAIPDGAREARPPGERTPPPGDEIVNPAEFCRAEAMIIYWTSWHSQELIDMCLAVADDDKVICCCSSSSQQSQAHSMMSGAGVNMANIDFFVTASGSVWIRDYGPFCVYDDGALSITDCMYGAGGGIDMIPVYIAQEYGLPWYQSSLVHHGGNHITDGNRMGFFSENLTQYNSGWSMQQIREEMQAYLGIDSVVVFGRMQGDATGHCDMFVKLLSDTLFVVSEYESPEDGVGNDYYFLNDLAATLDGMRNLDGRDFAVARLPLNPIEQGAYYYNKTYTNSLILNDKVLVPIYNTRYDARALQVYADCLPGHEIIGIDSEDVIEYLGAIHCISNTLHHANPLMILHEPLAWAPAGSAPVLSCRLNPRFADREVELYYSPGPGLPREVVTASFADGVWHAPLEIVYDDFDYWFVARAYTDAGTMETTLPENAPAQVFTCTVSGGTDVASAPMLRRPLAAWPNPFNPQATLGFALSREASVTLEVFDAAGRLQRLLLAGERLPAGGHEITWDGRDGAGRALPSGVYLCRMAAAGETSTRRLMLLK